MEPPETIELPAAVLVRERVEHAEQVATAIRASLDHLRPWMPWATPAAAEPGAQRTRLAEGETHWAEGSEFVWSLRTAPDGPVIGGFGLHRRIGPGGIEIGYWVHVDHVRRGHARAAAGALTGVGLALPDVDRVEIHTDEDNLASAAVPARLGYRLDRVEVRAPEAPAETGRLQIWVTP